LTISHNIQCGSCSYHQRIAFNRFDTSGEMLSYDNLLSEDKNYILLNLKRNKVIINDQDQLVMPYSTLLNTWQSESLFVAHATLDGQLLSIDTIDYRSNSNWLLYGPQDLVKSGVGEYLTVGYRSDSLNFINQTPSLAATMKINSQGEIIWRQAYEQTRRGYLVENTINGGYWLAASRVTGTFSFGVEYPTNAVIIKTDSLGQELWRHEFGGYGHDEITGIIEEPDRLVVTGFQTHVSPLWSVNQSESRNNAFVFLRSYTEGQSELTQVTETIVFDCASQSENDAYEVPTVFSASQFGGYLLGGFGYIGWDVGAQGQHGFLTRINSNLDTLWYRRYFHPYFTANPEFLGGGGHWINDIAEAPDGSIYMVGHVWGYSPPEYPWNIERLWLLHVDEHGCLEPGCHLVGTEEIITHMTETMSVYPNPARDNCTIAFSLIEGYTAPAQSQLKLVDMQGRIVRTIALSGAEVAGGKVQVDLSGLASGVYVAHWMDGGRWMDSVKIVVE